jgi:hypothetical protein
MKQLSKVFLGLAVLSAIAAIVLKRGIPGLPVTWLRITDTCLLFAIALSLANCNK